MQKIKYKSHGETFTVKYSNRRNRSFLENKCGIRGAVEE